jgi:hypothetical protein
MSIILWPSQIPNNLTVVYDELEGSPSYHFERRKSTGKRVFRIAWADIDAFLAALFPLNEFGLPLYAYDVQYPFLAVTSIEVEPWDPGHPDGNFDIVNRYTAGGAKMTVNMTFPFESTQDSSSPGGQQNTVFLTEETDTSVEYLVNPDGAFEYFVDANGEPYGAFGAVNPITGQRNVNPNCNVAQLKIPAKVPTGVPYPIIHRNLTLHEVASPPWPWIRAYQGCVNNDWFLNAAPETLLFLGCKGNRELSVNGNPYWTLGYKFAEKCYNFFDVWTYINLQPPGIPPPDPQGWNHFPAPIGDPTAGLNSIRPGMRRVIYSASRLEASRRPPFPLVDFSKLFIQMKPGSYPYEAQGQLGPVQMNQ